MFRGVKKQHIQQGGRKMIPKTRHGNEDGLLVPVTIRRGSLQILIHRLVLDDKPESIVGVVAHRRGVEHQWPLAEFTVWAHAINKAVATLTSRTFYLSR